MAKKVKLNLSNDNLIWDANRRYKTNSVVQFNGVSYQNTTGKNTSPDLLLDWQKIVDGVELHAPTHEATGTDPIQGENLSVNIIPPTSNYIPTTPTLKGHLQGIDTALGNVVQTTAGITSRVFYTGDLITLGTGTFYLSNYGGKGTVATASPTPLVNDDNQKKYFAQDIISVPFDVPVVAPAGVYSGNLSVRINNDNSQQRYTIEVYRASLNGTPLPSGVTGAPVGGLGVTVVSILDSGLLNLVGGDISSINLTGYLTQEITFNVNERLRYRISAEKVGTTGGTISMEVFYGNSYNSYYDVPVIADTNSVLNRSTVVGTTTTNALDSLNTGKQATLVSGTNVKTVGGTSILGSGNIPFPTIDQTLIDGSSNAVSNNAVFDGLAGKFNTPIGLTTNYLPKWNGSGFGNSVIQEDINGSVGVGLSPNLSTSSRRVIDINGSSQSMLSLSVGGLNKGFIFHTGTDLLVSNEITGALKFNTNGAERFQVTPSGNALFGKTDDTGERLQVNGGGSFEGQLKINVNTSTTPAIKINGIVNGAGAGSIQFFQQDVVKWNLTTTTNNDFGLYNQDGDVGFAFYIHKATRNFSIGDNIDDGNRLRVNGSGSFAGKLSIVGALSSGNTMLDILNSQGGRAYFQAGRTGITNSGISIKVSNLDGSQLREVIAVSSDDNILFGTDLSDNGARVQVNGNITASPAVAPNHVVVKSQLDAFVPSGTVNLMGLQTITGSKIFDTGINSVALSVNNSGTTASGIRITNASTGVGVFSYGLTGSTGDVFQGGNNTVPTFRVNKEGDITANKLIIPNAVNANEAVNKGQLDAVGRPYKVYTALLTQTGTNAPTAIVLENTLGGTLVWTRDGDVLGHYTGTLAGVFLTDPFYVTNNWGGSSAPINIEVQRINNNSIMLWTRTGLNTADNLLNGKTSIEIRVYN